MIRKSFLFFGIVAICFQMNGQLSKHLAPINSEFLEYQYNLNLHKKSAQANELFNTGYIPPFVRLPESYTSTPTDENLVKSAKLLAVPTSYDLRSLGKVTSVKYQGSGNFGGNCWSFASIASIESRWMVSNYGTYDLSEQNMASCHKFEWAYGDGGNEYLTMAYLSRLDGPVLEADVPYNTSDHVCKTDFAPVSYVPEVRWVYNNPVYTKRIIMDYGAVTTNIYWNEKYYNASNFTYYSNDIASPNHQVTIVGWDDNITTVKGNGAWIAKNSWNTTWGDQGYFYIAYSDNKILNPIAYYPTRWDKSEVDNLYRYDDLGVVTFFGYSKDYAYSLSKYIPVEAQYIKKVGTFLPRTGSIVEVEIYDNFINDSLKSLLVSYTSDPVKCPGFYAFDIPVAITDTFYVKVKYITPGFDKPIPVEVKVDGYSNPTIEPSGEQWVSKDGADWQGLGSDIKNWEANLVVHVYTENSLAPKANFTSNKFEVCQGSTVEFTNKSVGNITTYQWNFGAGALPATATGAGPHSVIYSAGATVGLRNVTLTITGPDGTDVMEKELKVVDQLTALVAAPNYLKIKDTATITAIGDADSYKWSPSIGLSSTTNKVTYFHSTVPGKYKFTVSMTQDNCTGSGAVDIDLRTPPINDEPCDAIELQYGDNGPFTNEDATVDFNEPMPVDTNCYDPLTWCDEGGLQNSVWFKVTGPAGGKLTLVTSDLDTQIALYKSATCDNIKMEDLIAANDDYQTEAPYAAALELAPVVAGNTYWVQIDGSGGGVSGPFHILMSEWSVNVPGSYTLGSSLSVFPNPGIGLMNVLYSSSFNEDYKINVYDISGKLLLSQKFNKTVGDSEHTLDLIKFKSGIYFINANGKYTNQIVKYIIK